MSPEAPSDFVLQLETEARARYVRWDPGLWRDLVEGPARRLADSLQQRRVARAEARALCESYLRLGAEGIGLGHLFPATAGDSFFTLAWTRLLPEGLAALPAERRAAVLAMCWNLGENLESSPVWLRRIFLRLCREQVDLGALEEMVASVSRRALEAPDTPLGKRVSATWVHLGDEDPRFLPGAAHFLAPSVACVHDRLRVAVPGQDAATIGVWLTEPPLTLGPMGCREEVVATSLAGPLARAVGTADPRVTEPFAGATNEWRAVLSLVTSQYVIAVLPA